MEDLNQLENIINVANKNGGFNTVQDAAIAFTTLHKVRASFDALHKELASLKKESLGPQPVEENKKSNTKSK